jgi:hypothetical protein
MPEQKQDLLSIMAGAGLSRAEIKAQLEKLRDDYKKQQGYLSKSFNIFASPQPLGVVMSDVKKFAAYCEKNGIGYDEATKRLVQGERPKTRLDSLVEMRFALAAIGGGALGLGGVNLMDVPVLKETPGFFFSQGLPWLAAGFIGLNVFKAFSEYGIIRESQTLARFSATTLAGFGISYLAATGMAAILPPLDPSTIPAIPGDSGGGGGFNPMMYMMNIIGTLTAAAIVYKGAKNKAASGFKAADSKYAAVRLKEKIAALAFNRVTAPPIVAAGNALLKGANAINKIFPAFINFAGIPAVTTLLSYTMFTGGVGQFGQFANYYLTAFSGMALGTAALLGSYYAMGARGRDFAQLGSAFKEGFFISSSSACLPKEKQCLMKMGVTEKTADAVLPLAGVFNMYGTSLYLGLTAFYAINLFNSQASIADYASVAASVYLISMGAPGITASNIAFLDPVLRHTSLSPEQIHKVFAMVAPMDRLLDMTQTGMNVLGDMWAAAHRDRHLLAANRDKAPPARPQ